MPRQDRCLRGKTGAFSEAALNSPGTALTLTRRAGNICRIWGRKEGSNAFIVAHLTCRRAPDLGGCTSAVERSERCFGRSIESWHSRHQSDDRFAASSHSKSRACRPNCGIGAVSACAKYWCGRPSPHLNLVGSARSSSSDIHLWSHCTPERNSFFGRHGSRYARVHGGLG